MKHLIGNTLKLNLNGNDILKAIDFTLKQGEILGLIGPNGAGKTSLLRILAGLLPPTQGNLLLDQEKLSQIPIEQRAKRIAYLAQSGTAQWPMRVDQLIALGRLPHLTDWQSPGKADEEKIAKVIQQTDLEHLRARAFNTLSGGERARVLLARALVTEPEILLADEPIAALDLAHQLEVMSLLRDYCQQGGAAVVVLHDLQLAAHYCDRLQLIHSGRTLATGLPDEVLTSEHIEQAFGIKLRDPEMTITDAFSLPWKQRNNCEQ